MTGERCLHELVADHCVDCGPPPPGLTRRVVVTRSGMVFHRRADCRALGEGQRYAEWRGDEVHDPVVVSLGEARADGRGACVACFPRYRPGRDAWDKVGRRDFGAVGVVAPVDPWPELVDALERARCAVAAAVAGGADRRRLVEVVSRALVDIRGLVWPGAAAARLPGEADASAA